MSRATPPVIACQNVWQVFGPNAKAALADALRESRLPFRSLAPSPAQGQDGDVS